MSTGCVILVGAGPGDAGLLTLRGLEALHTADAVLYDSLTNKDLLGHVPELAERINVGKQPGKRPIPQEEINRILVERAREGKRVVRLKGGDPFVFGRGGEEVLALLDAGVPFEVVPGVTAGVAAPACAGIPLTHRGKASCVTFVTGHEDPEKNESSLDWNVLAHTGGTLVIYMGVKRLGEITSKLIAAGLGGDTPAAVIERGTMSMQRSVRGTLGGLAAKADEAGIDPPAVTVIGEVAGLPDELNWFERRPLHGKRVVITRPQGQALDMSAALARTGARIVPLPTIEIVDPPSWDDVDLALATLGEFDWVVFTSVNAVWRLLSRLRELGRDVRAFASARVAALGSATADALARHGIRPDLVPGEFLSDRLVTALAETDDLRGKRMLLPRSSIGRKVLPDGLAALGADVTEVTLYVTRTHTHPDAAIVEAVRTGACDVVTFTSSSTVNGFVEIVGQDAVETIRNDVTFASIGPVTSTTCREFGIPVGIEAVEHTSEGLFQAILDSIRST